MEPLHFKLHLQPCPRCPMLLVCPSLQAAPGNPSSFQLKRDKTSNFLGDVTSSALRSNAVFSLSKQSLYSEAVCPAPAGLSPQRQHLHCLPSTSQAPGASHSAYCAAYLCSLTSGLFTFLQFSCFLRLKLSKNKNKK